MAARILLLHTGGTLGMTPSGPPTSLAPGPYLNALLERVPELRELADLELEVPFNRDSATVEPEHILSLARRIRFRGQGMDGVVLIHGTDTMAFTASVLGFLLADLGKPVVLTGSQRPLAYVRSDARNNLIDAVDIATRGVAEIGICFGTTWIRGVGADKISVHQYKAFSSPNLPPLANIGMDIEFHPEAGKFLRRVPAGLGEALESSIAVYRPHPGMPWHLPHETAKGILIEAYGAGNLPMDREDLQQLLGWAQAREIPVVVTTQCREGVVDLETYAVGRALANFGAIAGGGLTRWAVLAKLGLLLGANRDLAAIREAFGCTWAGEGA